MQEDLFGKAYSRDGDFDTHIRGCRTGGERIVLPRRWDRESGGQG